MRKWAAYLLCFVTGIIGNQRTFLARLCKQEEKADILQEQLKEIYETKKRNKREVPTG